MRHIIALAFYIVLAIGCGKKPPPSPPPETENNGDVSSTDTTAADRTKLLNGLKSPNQKIKRDAIEELAGWVDSDPESVTALLDLLKDKSTGGSGKIIATRINSTREAAAITLLWSGPKGEAALKDKGLSSLRDGLKDPQAVIREHTAYTIGLLGPLASPLSADVMKLCTDSDANVRGVAFDALNSIGIADVPGFIELLNNGDQEIGKLAAERVHSFTEIPEKATASLTVALGSDEPSIRLAAAAGLVTAGPKNAAAAEALMQAIKKSYPAELNLTGDSVELGSEMIYWRALARIGEPAVIPTIDLLTHTNALVRALAAKTLGEIGLPAKSAVGKLKGALRDRTIAAVPIEAACALCAIGEGKDDAVELMRRLMEIPDVTAKIAIEALPRMGEAGKPLIQIALGKLASDNPYARFAAAGLVGTLPPEEATKHASELAILATDKVPDIRFRAGFVLEKLGKAASPAAEAIGKAYKDEPEEVIREQFLDALMAMGPGAKPALPLLLPLARDKSLTAARQIRVISALGIADPASKDVLATLLSTSDDKDPLIRVASATALGKLDPLPPEAIAKLVTLAKSDKNAQARLSALRALAMAGPRAKSAKGEMEAIAAGPQAGLALWAKVSMAMMDENVAKAATAVRAALTGSPAAREAAAETLILIGPTQADLPALVKLLKDFGSTTRAAAARCIGMLGPRAKETVPQLLPLVSDSYSEVRIAAVEALGDLGVDSIPVIKKLQDMKKDPLVESAAMKALAKLGAEKK